MLEITVNNYYSSDISEFIGIVIEKLQQNIINGLSRRQLSRVTEYLNSDLSPYYYLKELRNPITLYADEIFEGALKNLTFSKDNEKRYKIFIDPTVYTPQTNISYASAIALITYGNLTLNPYPIFSEKMEEMDKEIPQLFEDYIEENL